MPQTEAEKQKKAAEKRAARTPEQVEADNQKRREREARKRAARTPEQVEADKKKESERNKKKRESRTHEQVEADRKNARERSKKRRANRTDAKKEQDKLTSVLSCKTCNVGKTRMIANCSSVQTSCYGCIKAYLLDLAKNPNKSYLTVKVLKEDALLKVSNPLFVKDSSDEWEDQPFFFVDIRSDKTPFHLPIVCIMAERGAFDKK
jgi:hypothetical protein